MTPPLRRRLVSPNLSPESSTKPTPKLESLERSESRETEVAINPLEISEPEGDTPIRDTNEMHIDTRVPPKIMRLTQHMHNLIYIRFFYEQLGQQPPVWIKRQLERAEVDLLEEIAIEEDRGGHFHERSRK